jgi:6-phospho-3-hexuloisomerase
VGAVAATAQAASANLLESGIISLNIGFFENGIILMTSTSVQDMSRQALADMGAVFERLDPMMAQRLCDEIVEARRIACFGAGREGLMIRALCMRLMHLGFDAHMVGDMTTPPVGPGDLVMITSGAGTFSMGTTMVHTAKSAGARVLVITAQPDSPAPNAADVVIHLPAQTMANDQGANVSLLPMGSLFEAVELVFFDLISIMLRERTNQSPEDMRHRHTNLE